MFAAATRDRPGIALLAVGGYGRAELCPGSDLDLLLLHSGWDVAALQELAEAIWYPLWDTGLKVGHATRTVEEALSLASSDLDTATALLDARRLGGDGPLAHAVAAQARSQWRAGTERWLPRLAEAAQIRHSRAGEVAFLLEPDLKEGRGGLRDIHALGWAEAGRRTLFDGDHDTIAEAHRVLLEVRVELHRVTAQASNSLLLQDQDAVAAGLGYADADADVLMRTVSAAARTVAWRSDDAWARVGAVVRRGRVRHPRRPSPGPGLEWSDGALELGADADPEGDPGLVLRAAAAAAGAGTRIGRAALDRLAAEAPALDGTGPWSDAMRYDLVALLAAGPSAIGVLEALDQAGLLVRFLPEWQAVRSRPQRNAYHRFTVDRHLFETAAGAAALTGRVHRPDLLLVGALLHDIGKGYVPELHSDHSEAGVIVVDPMATRMGFAPDDVAVLVTLVRHHLLLADAATRRDIDDPATMQTVADALGRRETLHLLHALTEADSLATGPAAWSSWKAGLVTALVGRVEQAMAGEEAAAVPAFPGPTHAASLARTRDGGEVVVDGRDLWVTIAAPDRAGLFSQVAGTLAIHGLDVLTARAWTGSDGVVVEEFRVEPEFGGQPDWNAFAADLGRVLDGELSIEEKVVERAQRYSSRRRRTAAETSTTSVTIDNAASTSATVVEVRAPDHVGALYRFTRVLADLSLDIHHAKVTTLGHEVIDAFYVVDSRGEKLDAALAGDVERALLADGLWAAPAAPTDS